MYDKDGEKNIISRSIAYNWNKLWVLASNLFVFRENPAIGLACRFHIESATKNMPSYCFGEVCLFLGTEQDNWVADSKKRNHSTLPALSSGGKNMSQSIKFLWVWCHPTSDERLQIGMRKLMLLFIATRIVKKIMKEYTQYIVDCRVSHRFAVT